MPILSASAESTFVCGDAEYALPHALVSIQEQAFSGIPAKSVYIHNTVVEIESEAFADCAFLEWIRIPESVNTISKDAFQNCSPDLRIYGTEKSKAQEFAYSAGFHFFDEVTGKEIKQDTLPEIPIP